MTDSGRSPSGRAAAAGAVEPSSTVSSKAGIPNADALDDWAFNVMLECAGTGEAAGEVAIGGAVLSLHDLKDILYWAQDTAIAMEARQRPDREAGLDPKGDSAVRSNRPKQGGDS